MVSRSVFCNGQLMLYVFLWQKLILITNACSLLDIQSIICIGVGTIF